MKLNICFIMYPWEKINPKQDSTFRMIHEALRRGHKVALTRPAELTIQNTETMSNCDYFEEGTSVNDDIPALYDAARFRTEMVALKKFDVIFMRDNPPMDNLMLNFLDPIKDDVFIINGVDGLRKSNNKIYTAVYHDPQFNLIPATHVSKDVDHLMKIIKESNREKWILKPLNGYGGSGIIIIETAAIHNIRSLLDFYIHPDHEHSNFVILQEYIEGAEDGDVRVLILNGEPIGAIRRIPKAGEGRANISVGGSVAKYDLSDEELATCRKIGKKLVRDEVYYAGIDLIQGKLVEVNVMSPGTITDINRLNGVRLQERIIDFLEERTKERRGDFSKY